MVGKIIFQTLVLFLVYCVNMVSAQDMVAGKDGNIRNLDGKAMLADNGELYVATRSEIYRSSGSSGKWDSIFILPPGSNEINCLGGSFGIIYAGTKRGLFRSQDYGRTWKNVFKAMVPEKNNVLSIATAGNNPKRLIIGTEGGIFLSDNAGERWQDISSSLKSKRVKYAALINGSMYACTDDGLYVSKTEPAGAWERIYVLSRVEEVSADSEAVDSADERPRRKRSTWGAWWCITNKGQVISGW